MVGSSALQVIVFQPNSAVFRAAPRICICEHCKVSYGSRELFGDYQLSTQTLNKVSTRANFLPESSDKAVDESDQRDEFVMPGTICAVAADSKSSRTIWFISISDEVISKQDVPDGAVTIPKGLKYFRGFFLEESKAVKDGVLYSLNKKRETFFYRELIVYPFVQFESQKNGYFHPNKKLVETLNYVEASQLQAL